LVLFFLIYTLLFILFLYLLNEKIKHGPEPVDDTSAVYAQQKGLFNKKKRSH
jgi:cytochrome bd-type quinol oxidase subunit 1